MKYRPRHFGDILGQAEATEALRRAVSAGSVRNAYLLTGPSGTGKTTAARILAASVNCRHPADGEPCGSCDGCEILTGEPIEPMRYYHEVSCAEVSDKEAVRQALQHMDLSTPANRRVYVLDEAHALTMTAQTWLLNSLERDNNSLILFCTTEREALLPTLRSRCVEVGFTGVTEGHLDDLVEHVAAKEGIDVDRKAVRQIVVQARGSARTALALLDGWSQGVVPAGHEAASERIVAAMAHYDVGRMLLEVRAASASGQLRPGSVLDRAIAHWLDVLVHKRRLERRDLPKGGRAPYRYRLTEQHNIGVASLIREESIVARINVLREAKLREPSGIGAELALEAALVVCLYAMEYDRHLTVVDRLDVLRSRVDQVLDLHSGSAP